MSRILYRAKFARGADVADCVEAASAVELRDKLATAGMTDIVLLQSPDIAALSNAPLPGLTQKRQARLRADLMDKPGLATALRGMIRINRVGLLIVFVLLVLSVWRQNLPLLAIAATLLLLPFGIFFWKRRHRDRYQSLMKAYARSQWDEVRKLAPTILDGLDVALLPPLAPKFIAFANGSLRLRAGEPDEALPYLRTATEGFLESSLQSPAACTALAICSGYHAVALARSGRSDAARQMIADVLPIINVHGEQPLLDMLQHEVLNIAA